MTEFGVVKEVGRSIFLGVQLRLYPQVAGSQRPPNYLGPLYLRPNGLV